MSGVCRVPGKDLPYSCMRLSGQTRERPVCEAEEHWGARHGSDTLKVLLWVYLGNLHLQLSLSPPIELWLYSSDRAPAALPERLLRIWLSLPGILDQSFQERNEDRKTSP